MRLRTELRARTELHGRKLARALEAAQSEDFHSHPGRVHLIGHSYGARVATFAAMNLAEAPRQITLLDVPDAPMTEITGAQADLTELLQQLPIGTHRDDVFVDNYVSMVGRRYAASVPGVVDVALTPPFPAFSYRQRHLYAPWFYSQTVGHGFGLGWSPLIAHRTPAPGCYSQPWGEIDLESGCPDF